MKRAFRVVLLLCLVLATVLIFAACNKTPTTPETTTPEQTTPEQTTPETTIPAEIQDPNVPQGSVPVDTLNGMNATQLYERFIEEYFSSAQFDIELTIEQTDGDDVVFASSIATKISGNGVYYSLVVDGLMGGKPMEVWLINDVAFVNSYGKKIKRENIATIDEIIGEGALDAVWSSFKQDLPKEYLDALATAQLYCLNDVYFYTVTVSMPSMGYDSITETVSFDKNGKVISVTDVADGYYTKGIIHSYGKSFEILPPEDADEYMPEFIPVDALNGWNAAQLYENSVQEYNNSTTYDIQFTQIQLAGSFTTSKNITVNGNNLYYRYARGGYTQTEIYLIGDAAYINVEGNKIKYFRTDVTGVYGEDFLYPIEQLTNQKVPAAYYTALETAQLYFDTMNDAYYYTVTFFATEESTIPTTETVYFDKNGKLIKITDTDGVFDKEIVIKCNTPVEVLPPEYPGEYYVAPKIPLTEEEIYLFYVDACTYLQNTQFLEAHIDAPDIDTDIYRRYGENKYIGAYAGSQSTEERWILDNTGFIQIGWTTAASKTPVDAAFLKHFTDTENFFPIYPFQQEELQNISCFYDMRVGRIFVTFERVDESGALFLYEYTIWDNQEWIDVDITKYVDEVKVETSAFGFIIDPLRTINPPN